MPHISLIDTSDDPATAGLIDRFKAGRRGSLIGIYRALLHNPDIAESWFNHLNAVRWKTSLSGRLREIVIIRVGALLNCAYILRQHVPHLARPEGLTDDECAALTQPDLGDGFSEAERSVLALVDDLTRQAQVGPQTVSAVQRHFDDKGFVEIVVLIGTYNMHARFVAGVGLELESP